MNTESAITQPLQEYLQHSQLQPRFERKFVVPQSKLVQVEQLLRFHALRFHQVYAPRQVNNIYLDTSGFRFYHDSIEGLSDRIKTRIRWYGKLLNASICPGMEIKIKKNHLGYKLVFPLSQLSVTNKTTPNAISNWLQSQEVPDMARILSASLQPVLVNTYTRSYWSSRDDNIRITMDRDLQYFPFARCTDTPVSAASYDHHIIIEIKSHPDQDGTVRDIADEFLPRITRYSKYTNGVDLLFSEQSMTY